MARRKSKKRRVTSTRRRRRRTSVAVNAGSRRRRRTVRRVRHRMNPRVRRRHRRNPALSGGGIMKVITRGAIDGFSVTLGRGITRLVASKVPFGQTSTVGQGAMQVLVGTALAMGVRKVTKSERAAAFFLAGAFSNIIQGFLTPVPVLGPMVTGGLSSYPQIGLSSYPRSLPAAAPRATRAPGIGQPWTYDMPELSDGVQS